jgi:spore coat polysaccharide biosynthesis predicted glycosyltransferase SpsG
MEFESTGIEILFLFCSDVEAVLKALVDAIALSEGGSIHELLVLAKALRFDFFLID